MLRVTTAPAWSNWAGTATCRPARIARPTTAREVAEVVASARASGRRVRAVGSGHSFTPLAATDGVLVDLAAMTGLAGVDPGRRRVRVRAGTTLREANRLLALQGLALPNLGDIDAQTVAGAISTGTHGTGARFPGLAAGVTAAQVVLADGEIAECSGSQRRGLFEAARLSLGAVGVLTEVEFACVPAFLVHATERPGRLRAVLGDLDAHREGTDHFEFFWFPHTDRVLTKHNRRLAPEDAGGAPLPGWRRMLDDELLSNGLFGQACRLGARRPSLVPVINAISGRVLSAREFTGPSYEVFATTRRVRFRESEYAVPVAALPAVLAELRRYFHRSNPVSFPVEVRFAAADDVWLSTGYGRDNAYVAVHEYVGASTGDYFARFEAICAAHEGRPHWGKLHGLGAEDFERLYPRLGDFRAVRDEVDPERVFGSPHVERVIGG